MKCEDQKCNICEINIETCIYNNPIVKVIKDPSSIKPNMWIAAPHRHTSLPIIGEIKCLKHAIKKLFPSSTKIDRYQKDPYTHFHWIIEGKPINIFKYNKI
jgi:hypothetical protein